MLLYFTTSRKKNPTRLTFTINCIDRKVNLHQTPVLQCNVCHFSQAPVHLSLSRKNQLQQACKVHVPLGVQWVTDQFACRVAIFTNNRRIGPLFGEVPTATSLGPSSWKTSSVAVVADGLSFRSNYKEVIQASWTVFDQYYSSCLLIFYDSFFYLPGVCPSHHIYCITLKWSHVHKVFNLI